MGASAATASSGPALVEREGGGHDAYLCSVAIVQLMEVGERPLHRGDIARPQQGDEKVPPRARADRVWAREHLAGPFRGVERGDGCVVPATDELEAAARGQQHDGGRGIALGADPALGEGDQLLRLVEPAAPEPRDSACRVGDGDERVVVPSVRLGEHDRLTAPLLRHRRRPRPGGERQVRQRAQLEQWPSDAA